MKGVIEPIEPEVVKVLCEYAAMKMLETNRRRKYVIYVINGVKVECRKYDTQVICNNGNIGIVLNL